MKIETARFGTLEFKDDRVINLLWGMPGFEDFKRYIIFEYRDGPFQWLQCVDEPDLAFVICVPEMLGVSYIVPPEKREPLKLTGDDDLRIFNLVSFASAKNTIRFHMHSPLLFNMATRTAYQWTMDAEELQKYVKIPEGLSWEEEPLDLG